MILTALLLMQAGVQATPGDVASEVDCTDPVTQTALNICSFDDFRAADAALNEQWGRASAFARDMDERLAEYGETADTFARLLDAQRKWLAYRDAHCLALNGPRTPTSGTIWPLIQNTCMENLTLARVELLRQYADQPN